MNSCIDKSLVIIFCGLLFLSCDFSDVKYEDLVGKWVILSAERNGRTTQTLDNVFFKFDKQAQMTTNLFGFDESFHIEYSFPIIQVTSSKLDKLNVKNISGDTLSIMTRINQHRYDFRLLKN